MITWIQTVLQKHHKSVFSVLLVVIIIAFVFTIGQVPFLGDRNRGERANKEFYGFDLSNENVMGQLQNCAMYEAILAGISNGLTQDQFTRLVLRQAYLMSVAKNLGLRQVSEEEFAKYVESSPIFADANGKFDAALWQKFRAERVGKGRMGEEAFASILAQNALVSKVASLLGGPGYLFKSEIEREYSLANGTWNFSVATLLYDDFKPDLKADAVALEKYFQANIEQYRIGEGVAVEAVCFPAAQYAAKVSAPSEADIAAYYGANMRKYQRVKNGQTQIPQLSEVKSEVAADLLAESSLRAAANAAEEFAIKIYDSGAKFASDEFKKFMADAKMEIKKFGKLRMSDKKLPDGMPREVAFAALRLDENSFYSDPVVSEDKVWVVYITEKMPSYLPKFADVKAEVEKNWLDSEKRRLFSERGQAIDKSISEAVKSGKKFSEAARGQGASVEKVSGFCFAKNDELPVALRPISRLIASELPSMKVGSVSKMQTFFDNGYIIWLESFKAPEAAADAKEFKELSESIERAFSSTGANAVIDSKISEFSED